MCRFQLYHLGLRNVVAMHELNVALLSLGVRFPGVIALFGSLLQVWERVGVWVGEYVCVSE